MTNFVANYASITLKLLQFNLKISKSKTIITGVKDSLEKNLATFFSQDEKRNWRFVLKLAYSRLLFLLNSCSFFWTVKRKFWSNARIVNLYSNSAQTHSSSKSKPMLWKEKHCTKKDHFITIFKHIWIDFFVSITLCFLWALVRGFSDKVCDSLSNISLHRKDVKETMKITHGLYFFPVWSLRRAFFLISYFNNIFPEFNLFLIWLLSILTDLFFLILNVIFSSTLYFFPGYWELAKLRLFFPRARTELMLEWKEISAPVVKKMDESKHE